MKKLVYLLAIAGLFAFASCKPKAASTEATKADSTKVDSLRIADSLNAAVADTVKK